MRYHTRFSTAAFLALPYILCKFCFAICLFQRSTKIILQLMNECYELIFYMHIFFFET